MLAGSVLWGCPKKDDDKKKKANDYYDAPVGDDPKAAMYNLIGRWYPDEEVKRLDNDQMTPEEWCARPPTHILVMLDGVTVQCSEGRAIRAAIARVERTKNRELKLVMRAKADDPLKELLFAKTIDDHATVIGSPCDKTKPTPHRRFPKFEKLRRSILAGKRCAQISTAGL